MTESDNKEEKYMNYVLYKQKQNKARNGTKGSRCGGVYDFK